ncbi:hypothetical protein BJ138DRAFT_1116080 [Hygrophoropsis aurantiaca]|uniref:Uncharacterized protein n=1 Tax=Hygrophoropsis aurantiaca TaxID=72124 RepID=A0ACB8A565_9AGAM|nr:hypothetical protein BJ138DRAFT_1116080 [Hygrophoropsis aurantiaca]
MVTFNIQAGVRPGLQLSYDELPVMRQEFPTRSNRDAGHHTPMVANYKKCLANRRVQEKDDVALRHSTPKRTALATNLGRPVQDRPSSAAPDMPDIDSQGSKRPGRAHTPTLQGDALGDVHLASPPSRECLPATPAPSTPTPSTPLPALYPSATPGPATIPTFLLPRSAASSPLTTCSSPATPSPPPRPTGPSRHSDGRYSSSTEDDSLFEPSDSPEPPDATLQDTPALIQHFIQGGMVTRRQKSMRNKKDPVNWYMTEGPTSIKSPTSSIYSHLLRLGDLRIHQYGPNKTTQAWVWNCLGWAPISYGHPHPKFEEYRFVMTNGQPGWVTKRTLSTYRGRYKKAFMEEM